MGSRNDLSFDDAEAVNHRGFSSTMRRASEMSHVERIIQVGMRGLGSARRQEVELAQQWGATLIPARKVFADGSSPSSTCFQRAETQ